MSDSAHNGGFADHLYNLSWIFLLIGIEQLFDQHPRIGWAFIVVSPLVHILSRKWPAMIRASIARLRRRTAKGNPPSINVEVTDGRIAILTVKKTGAKFTLITRGQITKASLLIDRGAPYEFQPRPIDAGDQISGYQIATVNETNSPGVSVKVRGEWVQSEPEVIQRWHQEVPAKDFWFEIHWTFLWVSPTEGAKEIRTLDTKLTFDAQNKRLVYNKAGDNPGILSVNFNSSRF